MANIKPKMTLALRQNNNMESKAYGKYYPALAHRTNISQAGLAKHIASHGLGVQPAIINAVVTQFSKCLVEMLQQGIGVQLDNFGIFYPMVHSSGLADPTLVLDGEDPVEGIRMRFLPSSTEDCNLTAKAFKQRVSLEIPYVEVKETYVDPKGDTRAKRSLKLVSDWEDNNQQEPENP